MNYTSFWYASSSGGVVNVQIISGGQAISHTLETRAVANLDQTKASSHALETHAQAQTQEGEAHGS